MVNTMTLLQKETLHLDLVLTQHSPAGLLCNRGLLSHEFCQLHEQSLKEELCLHLAPKSIPLIDIYVHHIYQGWCLHQPCWGLPVPLTIAVVSLQGIRKLAASTWSWMLLSDLTKITQQALIKEQNLKSSFPLSHCRQYTVSSEAQTRRGNPNYLKPRACLYHNQESWDHSH